VDLAPHSAGGGVTGVTRTGLVVGSAYFGSLSGDSHAFSWTKAGGLRDLGALPGHAVSHLFAMTDQTRPVAVGMSCRNDPDTQRCDAVRLRLSTQGSGTFENLNDRIQTRGVWLLWATAMNRTGAVLAHGRGTDGTFQEFLLLPQGGEPDDDPPDES